MKLYGERNTGTNYLLQLCSKNLRCEVLPGILPTWWRRAQQVIPGDDACRDLYFAVSFPWALGWKHREVDIAHLRHQPRARSVHFLATTKNPYSWLVSIARRPHHLPFPEDGGVLPLCRTPIRSLRREGGPPFYTNAIDLWNRKMRSYLRLADEFPTTIVRFEDLLERPAQVVGQIGAESGAARASDEFSNIEASTKQPGKSNADYREYYGAEHWRDELDAPLIDEISALLDGHVMGELGYDVLHP